MHNPTSPPSPGPPMYCRNSVHSCAAAPCSRNWNPSAVNRVVLPSRPIVERSPRSAFSDHLQAPVPTPVRSGLARPVPVAALCLAADQVCALQEADHVARGAGLLVDPQHVVQDGLPPRLGSLVQGVDGDGGSGVGAGRSHDGHIEGGVHRSEHGHRTGRELTASLPPLLAGRSPRAPQMRSRVLSRDGCAQVLAECRHEDDGAAAASFGPAAVDARQDSQRQQQVQGLFQ